MADQSFEFFPDFEQEGPGCYMVGPRGATEMDEGGNELDLTHQGGFSDITVRKGSRETSTAIEFAQTDVSVSRASYLESGRWL